LSDIEKKKETDSTFTTVNVTNRTFTVMTLLEDETIVCTTQRGLTKTWDLEGRCLSCLSFDDRMFLARYPEVASMAETKDRSLVMGMESIRLVVIRRPVR